ncbi:hypothetical protein OGAPHI_001352 [Ogataea philodendri]|uniref:Enoyl reductase (ER) domain-containing protein n=1 Tax=Ogataea philodendri TaxID=1378263 RepID=A0A9P8T8Q6_9ASCO|nr:uncharacterized protein OGAPHI_001352 [Ogataea philodendri]KAH3669231.1 hypothetical protein OGAPHI_001352 [Ogataea philodendri]
MYGRTQCSDASFRSTGWLKSLTENFSTLTKYSVNTSLGGWLISGGLSSLEFAVNALTSCANGSVVKRSEYKPIKEPKSGGEGDSPESFDRDIGVGLSTIFNCPASGTADGTFVCTWSPHLLLPETVGVSNESKGEAFLDLDDPFRLFSSSFKDEGGDSGHWFFDDTSGDVGSNTDLLDTGNRTGNSSVLVAFNNMTNPLVTHSGDESPFVNPPGPQLPPKAPDLFSLKGKVCVITGAGRGIGYTVAEGFAQAGANVAFWDLAAPVKAAAKVAEENGVETKAYGCDVSDADKVDETILQIVKDFGTIDVFVANAGVNLLSGSIINEMNRDGLKWKRIMDINLNGLFYCARGVGRVFEQRGKGSLIFTGSMSGHIVNTPINHSAYNTSKAAVIHLAKCLAVEFKEFARVNSVSPGYIDSGINDYVDPAIRKRWLEEIPLAREGQLKEIVGAYLFFASDASTYATGSDLVVDGGYTISLVVGCNFTMTRPNYLPNPSLQTNEHHDLEMVEAKVGTPGPGEVVLHLRATGICGSDVHYWKHGQIGELKVKGQCILGHEAAGEVVELGPGVTELAIGDRVAIEPQNPCGECFLCLQGDYNLCQEVDFLSVWPCHGTMQRYRTAKVKTLFKLPDNMTYEEGALCEPLSVAYHGIENAQLELGRGAMICGAGPIGLATLVLANATGATPLAISDLSAERLAFAKKIVPRVKTYQIDLKKTPKENAAEIRKLFGPKEVDAPPKVLECTGVETSIVTGAHVVRRSGTLMVIGVGREIINNFPFMHLSFGEVDVKFINRYHQSWPAVIRLISDGIVDVKSFVTHRFPLEKAAEAITLSSDPKNGSIKVIIEDKL